MRGSVGQTPCAGKIPATSMGVPDSPDLLDSPAALASRDPSG